MAERKEFSCNVDLDDLAAEVGRVEEIGDRVRLAGYGLAAPLVKAREGQLRREIRRTANRKGADHPEVARRTADLARGEVRFALFREETQRARLTRPNLETETGAAVWGRVVDEGRPVTDVTVSVVAKGERIDFRCTDAVGGFAMEVPPAVDFVLSVRAKDGAELFRDREPQALAEGQVLYREIDLSRGAEVPCPEPPPEDGGEADETFPMLDLVGRREAAALALIRGQGLKLEDRKEEEVEGRAGLVIAQQPAAGTAVRRGDGISIVVGASGRVRVPDLIGLKLEEAEQALKKAGLARGAVSEVPVTGERGGLVVAQDPNAGAEVARGDKVALSVGKASEEPGGDEVTVPNVVGMKLEEAQITLKRAELRLGETKKVPADGDKVGLVLEQDPAAGARVVVGTRITLAVGVAREGGGSDDQRIRRIAELAEGRLREAGVIASDQPQGTVAQWLSRAGVRKTTDVDRLLTVDRQRLRERFGLRTLAETDKVIAALKRARSQVPD